MEIEHYDETNATRNERPEFISVVAANATPKIVGNPLVVSYEGNPRDEDEKANKE